MKPDRYTIGCDVDGVLHSYTSGWHGATSLPDPPVPGAIEWLEDITITYDVAINSTRAATVDGCRAIREWLLEHGLSRRALERVTIAPTKAPCLLYVDDRGWRFEGDNFPTREQIRDARPWWKAAKHDEEVFVGPEPARIDLEAGRKLA